MKIHHGKRPPNYADIVLVFPDAAKLDTIFTYGDDVFTMGSAALSRSLIAHESVHVLQQRAYPGGPGAWWGRYLADPAWRVMQELNAHQVEYADVVASGANRHERRAALTQIAKRLIGPLYGKSLKGVISLKEAKDMIERNPAASRATDAADTADQEEKTHDNSQYTDPRTGH